jgi:hypothetical protein
MSPEAPLQSDLEALQRQLPSEAQATMRRVLASVAGELDRMDPARYRALNGMTDAELLAELARRMIEHQPLHSARVARMRLRGAQRFASLVQRHGGSYRVREAAELMGTSDSAVRKALQRRRLVAFKQDGEWQLPVWQFGRDDQPLPGLSRALKALPPDISDRDVIRFLLLGPEGNPANSPLELLLRNTEAAIEHAERMARRYLEQIAA